MFNLIKNFFLSGFVHDSYFEKRKATYLFYIIISAFSFVLIVSFGQWYFQLGSIYRSANICAVAGYCLVLYFFKKKRVDLAGHLLAWSNMAMIFVETTVRDSYSHDPAIRYRLYLGLVALLGLYFIIISFFRDRRYVLFYAVAFELMLFSHAIVIYNQLKDTPDMGLFVWQHLITVSMGMVIIAAISTALIAYMEALFQQNREYGERFKEQNELLEKMVQERTKDLMASNSQLKEFAYLVSHDLKEPLRTISGFVALIDRELKKAGLSENEIAEYISFVKTGTAQMEHLIKDILEYSRLNTIEKVFDVVNVDEVIDETRGLLARTIYESDAKITVANSLNVKGNKQLLVKLFINLISNAIKYRSHNRPLEISIGCLEEKDMVRYYVKDNGIGISEKYYTIIFQAFRRLHSKINYEGTGVGLAICKKIVEIHGGEIWVESTEGTGTTFWFTLRKPQITDEPAMNPVVHAA